MSGLRAAKAVSLVGTKIEYIPNKHSDTTSAIIVLDFDTVMNENLVKSIGKPAQYRDVVRLLRDYPSHSVSKIAPDDPILLEYTAETANMNAVRKAAVDAVEKIKRDSGPQGEMEIEEIGPPPRRRRSMRPNGLTTCCICLSEGGDFVALQPCFHAGFCTNCSTEIMRRNANCPICRNVVTGTQRVFFT